MIVLKVVGRLAGAGLIGSLGALVVVWVLEMWDEGIGPIKAARSIRRDLTADPDLLSMLVSLGASGGIAVHLVGRAKKAVTG